MTNATAGSPVVHGYHAHVYYDAAAPSPVEKPRETLAAGFPVVLGWFSGEPVGPHPIAQLQRRGYFQTLLLRA